MSPDPPLRVTIVGLNYVPEPTGIAPYTARMASGLQEVGHRVSVVTSYPHYPEWRVPPGYSGWSRRDRVEGIPVTRVRHYVPGSPRSLRRVMSELSFGLASAARAWGEPDVVLSVSPALFGSVIVSARTGLPRSKAALGVIVQDLYSAGVGEASGRGRVVASLMGRLEGSLLRRADGVAVIHDRLKDRLVRDLRVPAERVDVIRNWTHLDDVDAFDRTALRARLGWGDETVVLHTGAMGEKQALENVVLAGHLADRRSAPVRFVLIGQGAQRAEIERAAADCESVEVRDPVSSDDFARVLRAADVLLVNERPGVREMAVPSKLTSYFSAGVAVLAATEPDSTTADEIAAAGAGIRVEPGKPEALVAGALRLREDEPLRRSLGSLGPAYCEKVLSEGAALAAYDTWVRQLHRRKHGSGA